MFFDQADRLNLRRLVDLDVDVDEATWNRARGRALSVSLAIAENSADKPRYQAMSAQTLARVATDLA